MILEILVIGPTARLAAGTLILALPLAAAAGCGVEKRRTVTAEFASAQSNLARSRAVSFTVRLDDSKGSIKRLATKDKSTSKGLVDAALPGSVTYTVDPASNATLASLGAGACAGKATATDLAAAIKKVNLALVVRDAHAAVAELRLVGGVLYAHVDLTEIGAVAKDSGVKDFDAKLDDAVSSADPAYAKGLADVKAGQWISLPLSKYLTKFQDLAKGFSGLGAGGATDAPTSPTPPTSRTDCKALSKVGTDVLGAIKPYVKVTDANDSSSNRVLDIKVKARPALKAALAVLQAAKGLPFAGLLKSVEPKAVDDAVADGTAHGTITLNSGHLTQATIDLESLRTLATDPGKDSFAGSSVVLDVNDKADEIAVPGNVSTFDVGALIDRSLRGLTGIGLPSGSSEVVG